MTPTLKLGGWTKTPLIPMEPVLGLLHDKEKLSLFFNIHTLQTSGSLWNPKMGRFSLTTQVQIFQRLGNAMTHTSTRCQLLAPSRTWGGWPLWLQVNVTRDSSVHTLHGARNYQPWKIFISNHIHCFKTFFFLVESIFFYLTSLAFPVVPVNEWAPANEIITIHNRQRPGFIFSLKSTFLQKANHDQGSQPRHRKTVRVGIKIIFSLVISNFQCVY